MQKFKSKYPNKYKNYIAAPANNFMPGTPPENIDTAYKTLKSINKENK